MGTGLIFRFYSIEFKTFRIPSFIAIADYELALPEVLLGNSQTIIRCGPAQLRWLSFSRAILCLFAKVHLPSESFRWRLSDLRDMLSPEYAGAKDPLSGTLLRYVSRECSDPHDKVYALLSLCTPRFRQRIEVDYDSPVMDVYVNTNVAYIEHTRRLGLLRRSSLGFGLNDCPSWVLDFCQKARYSQYPQNQFSMAMSSAHAQYVHPNLLEVLGVKCASVKEVSVPALGRTAEEQGSPIQTSLKAVRSWEPNDLFTGTYVTGESLLDAYSKILVAFYLAERFPMYELDDLARWKLQESDNALFGEKARAGASDTNRLSAQERYALSLIHGRTFITCNEGYIGLGPTQAQKGMSFRHCLL